MVNTETERLVWNLVSAIRAMAESDRERSGLISWAEPDPKLDKAMAQTEQAVSELAAALDAKKK